MVSFDRAYILNSFSFLCCVSITVTELLAFDETVRKMSIFSACSRGFILDDCLISQIFIITLPMITAGDMLGHDRPRRFLILFRYCPECFCYILSVSWIVYVTIVLFVYILTTTTTYNINRFPYPLGTARGISHSL